MAITFQYNKTSLQALEKNLKMRQRALPTLKNKESALRLEVKKAKEELSRLNKQIEETIDKYHSMIAIWAEFDATLIKVTDVKMEVRKIAGVRVPYLTDVLYETKPFSIFNAPKWFEDGIALLKELAQVGIEREFCSEKIGLLEYARKKSTQKVNLFEKIQIPGYEDAIRKIKRFMEDEENLSKSSQKIVKAKQAKVVLNDAI